MAMENLNSVHIGIFGAGRLGRAIALRLREGGVGAGSLMLCHGGATSTVSALQREGLAQLVRPASEVAERSDVLLYAVRPQQFQALAPHRLRQHTLFVSFLAGVPLERIPIGVPCQRIRIMPSAPDTLLRGRAIAAVYPVVPPTVAAILRLLGAEVHLLRQEADVHAFTVLGPCLPIAFAAWERLGHSVDERAVRALAEEAALPDFGAILCWARAAQPRGTTDAIDRSVVDAATPGGVTEAIVQGMGQDLNLTDCLRRGIARSVALSGG